MSSALLILLLPGAFSCDCAPSLRQNARCDAECYTAECNWDFPDCQVVECAPGCLREVLGNRVCDKHCMTAGCGFDGTDCGNCMAAGCLISQLGNGVCDPRCNNSPCGFDGGDCLRRFLADDTTDTEEPYKEHNYGLVAGVGLGTFLIIFSGALGLVFCICSFATSLKELCILIGIAIPTIVTCIIVFSPTEKEDREKKDTRVDDYDTARVLFLVMLIPFTLIAVYASIVAVAGIELKTRRVDSRAVGEARAEKLDLEGNANQQADEPAQADQALLPNPFAIPAANPQ